MNKGEIAKRLGEVHAKIQAQLAAAAPAAAVVVASAEELRLSALVGKVIGALRILGYSDRQIVAGLEGEDQPDLVNIDLAELEVPDQEFTPSEVLEATIRTLRAMGVETTDDNPVVDPDAAPTVTAEDLGDSEIEQLGELLEGCINAATSVQARNKLLVRLTASTNLLVLAQARDTAGSQGR